MVMQSDGKERDPQQGIVLPFHVVQKGPDPEVVEKPVARRFTSAEKAQILAEADQCRHGEVGALCRRYGIYSKTLSKWRKQREDAIREWLEPQQPGRKPAERNPLQEEVEQLKRENARLQKRLKQAETVIEVQKKISEILAIPLNQPESDKND